MSEDNVVKIIVAIIALIGTTLGFIGGIIVRSKKQAVIDAKREQKQNDTFNKLFDEMAGIKQRLDQHNHYAEKFGTIEKSIISMQKDIEYIRKDLK